MSNIANSLYDRFKPARYILESNGDLLHLTIFGQKIGAPSYRINLHQSGISIINAKVTRIDKHGPIENAIIRINHLPTIQQVRLHGSLVMYPGHYQIELDFKLKPDKFASLNKEKPNRELIPSIDETDAWKTAQFEFKQ